MNKWVTKKISDIGKVVGGATPSTKDEDNYGGDISWITPKDLASHQDRYILQGERSITPKGFDSCSAVMLPKGSILFSSRAPIGYVAIAAKDMCTNQGFKSIIPNEKIIDPLFLYYLLKANASSIASHGSGTTFPEISGKVMASIEVSFPESIVVQKRIASILDSLDSKIELNRKLNDNLEKQLELMYRKLKIDSDYSESATIDSFCSIFTGKKNANQFDAVGMYKFFTCGDTPLRINSFIYDGAAIIISGNGSYTGRTTFYKGKFDLYQRTYACTPLENVNPDFIYGLYPIIKYELQRRINGGTHGSSIPYIVFNDIAKFEFKYSREFFPEYSLQCKNLILAILSNQKEIDTLQSLRDYLLPLLMSGQISIGD